MTYQQGRDAEECNHIDDAITLFISRYAANLSNKSQDHSSCFPGGMGPSCLRATTPRQDGPPYSDNMVWLDCSVILGFSALNWKMQ